ncbi:unnamed protein product [Staurois parvus]|uniref:GIY-YIG domain-containing protein n=1 Tax=Staurois parvus TaxID=386267 RepID=A0ABN9AK11_9NEOB|nr:unnamed protein product [Staurois parvus]
MACRNMRGDTKRRYDSFHSCSTGSSYKINNFISCDSSFVTYLLECSCHLQYVGRTSRKLSVRLGEHIREILKKDINIIVFPIISECVIIGIHRV